LVLTTSNDRVGEIDILAPFPSCGHSPILLDYNFLLDRPDIIDTSPKRNWSKGKYGIIERHLQHYNWEFELTNLSVTDMFSRLQEIILPLVNKYVPLNQKIPARPRHSKPPAQLKREREQAWKSYKLLRSQHGRLSIEALEGLHNYDLINHQYRNFSISSQINYEASLIDRFVESTKFFHSYIRRKKVGAPTVGPLRLADGSLTEDCKVMAELFADGFSSVYTQNVPLSPAPHQSFDGNITEVILDEAMIANRFSKLDIRSSMGPDKIHPILLRSCPSLLRPFFIIFCESLRCGHLPSQWKESSIVPIFKKGSRYASLNYRPISLTSVACKALERDVADQLYDYFDQNGLLSKDQFGFRRGYTVDDQLLLTYDKVTHWVDSGSVVDVVLFDFAKAFDVVCHVLLIGKLAHLGVGGCLLQWISDFLLDRSMHVTVSGAESGSRDVKSGVPQGSVLGPLAIHGIC
jgi:hypothetical protein